MTIATEALLGLLLGTLALQSILWLRSRRVRARVRVRKTRGRR